MLLREAGKFDLQIGDFKRDKVRKKAESRPFYRLSGTAVADCLEMERTFGFWSIFNAVIFLHCSIFLEEPPYVYASPMHGHSYETGTFSLNEMYRLRCRRVSLAKLLMHPPLRRGDSYYNSLPTITDCENSRLLMRTMYFIAEIRSETKS